MTSGVQGGDEQEVAVGAGGEGGVGVVGFR